jgi:hypothetical protein
VKKMFKLTRTNYLINSRMQLAIVLYFLTIGIAVAVGSYFLLSRGFQGYIDQISAGLPGISKENFPEVLGDLRSSLMKDFLVSSISGLVGVLLGGILISHRIAGPLYRLETAMKSYLKSGDRSEVHLRKHDYGSELAALYNQVIKKVQP